MFLIKLENSGIVTHQQAPPTKAVLTITSVCRPPTPPPLHSTEGHHRHLLESSTFYNTRRWSNSEDVIPVHFRCLFNQCLSCDWLRAKVNVYYINEISNKNYMSCWSES